MRFRRPRLLLILGAVLVEILTALADANACPTPPLTALVYSPGNSEPSVPTNTVIDIHVFGDAIPPDIANQFSLWQQQTRISTTPAFPPRVDSNVPYITAVRLIPCSLCLVSNQSYQVRFGTSVTSLLIGTFTTANSPDLDPAPPPLTGASAVVNVFDAHPDGGSDCFTERIRQVRLSVPSVGKPVVYTIKEGNLVISADEVSLVGSFYCSGQAHWQGDTSWVVAPGQHTIQVSAVDRVGRASLPVDVSFNASCAGGVDGGSPDGGGTGNFPGNDSTVPVQPTSCSCGTGTSAAIALAGLATILRARRRKHSDNPSGEPS